MASTVEPSALWRRQTYTYADAVNAFVKKGLADGWENAGAEPVEPDGKKLFPPLMEALRAANQPGRREDIKAQWPPAHGLLIPLLNENGQDIPTICLLADGSILARLGPVYETGKVVHIVGDEIREVPGVQHFGRCPARRYFAVATADGVAISDGWQGVQVALCPWPTGDEGIPQGYAVEKLAKPPVPTRLLPFPDGQRVLLVSSEGIFVLSTDGAQRLLPTTEQMREHFEWLRKEYPEDSLSLELTMEHAAISADGSLIAVGSQDGRHLIFDAQLQCIAQIGPHGEYPHYALFSAAGNTIAFNACHFYNGATISVPVSLLPGLDTDHYEEVDGIHIIEQGARVYAGVSHKDEFIFGDAYGYLRAVSHTGEYRWQHFIGSTIGDIDVSADGRVLVVSTCAGFISIIELGAGQQPYQIGNGGHYEQRRWLFWRGEEMALAW